MEYIEINPPRSSTLTLEASFLDDCAPNLKPQITVEYPGDFVTVLQNGRILMPHEAHIAIITEDNMMVDELSFQWQRGRSMLPSSENIVFTTRAFLRPRKYKGTVFSLLSGGGAIHYYYHWMFDSIPKLHLLHQTALVDEVDYYLVPGLAYRYQRAYLKRFGIREDKIINGTQVQHLMADRLVVASYTRFRGHLPAWVCRFLHDTMLGPRPQPRRDKLIYIARGDAQRNRKVINEELLIDELKALGFESYFLSHLSIQEQASLFNSARMVVASHGGGLSNLVFCEPGTPVVEVFPDNYVNHLFYDVCNKCNLPYHYVVCESEKNADDEIQAETNLIADVKAIKKKVIEVIGIASLRPSD